MSTTEPDSRISEYNPVVATTQFAAEFPVFDNDDLVVMHDGTERLDFTISATYVEGVANDAKAVFVSGITGNVIVVGRRAPRRRSSFQSGAPLPIRDQNLALDTIAAELQEARRDIDLSLRVPIGVEPSTIPNPDDGTVLGWEGVNLVNKTPATFIADAGLATAGQGALADGALQRDSLPQIVVDLKLTDTPAQRRDILQAAIDAMAQRGSGYVTIAQPGIYTTAKRTVAPIDRSILMRKGVKLTGMGKIAAGDTILPYMKAVTLEPSEDMTFFISQEEIKRSVVSISNASPAVITWANHGFVAGNQVYFEVVGTIPTGLTPRTTYYVLAAGLTTNTFRVSLTAGGAAVATTSAGSGIFYCTRADILHSVGMEDICVSSGTTAVVDTLVMLSPTFSRFVNLVVENRAGGHATNGVQMLASWLAAWQNVVDNMHVGGFTGGYGFNCEISDSEIIGGHYSGCATNMRVTEGSVSIVGPQIENANNGGGVGTGVGLELQVAQLIAQMFNTLGNIKFISNKKHLTFSRGGYWAGTVDIKSTVTGCIFHDGRDCDIEIGSGCEGMTFAGNVYSDQQGANHVKFLGSGAQKYIQFMGETMDKNPVDRFSSNYPTDLQFVTHGVGGPFNRLVKTLMSSNGIKTVPDTALEVFGNDTVLGLTGVMARFGLTKSAAGFDVGLFLKQYGGTGFGFDLRNGDTGTAAGQLLFSHNANGRFAYDATGISFFGGTPVAKPTGVAVTAAGIHAALVSLGLIAP